MCLSCGYDGRLIQAGATGHSYTCPSCGADLYARPPRAYAEMEGLDESVRPASFERFARLLAAPAFVDSAQRARLHRGARRIALALGAAGAALAIAATAAAFGLL